MGVPISFIDSYNKNQFELVGITENYSVGQVYLNGDKKYTRLIIKRK